MSAAVRAATAGECARLWPDVEADRLMETRIAFDEYCTSAPWRIRVGDRGEAAVLGRWREGLDVLAIRDVWCSRRRLPAFVEDACGVARSQGLARVMSPLMPEMMLDAYLRTGMRVTQRIVAILGSPALVPLADPPAGVVLRSGTSADLPAVADLDRRCFDEFWHYREADLTEIVRHERFVVAVAEDGEPIGYTLATAGLGAVSLDRLCAAPGFRNRGVGRALLAETAGWGVRWGAVSLSLCTQEDNVASRSLYASAGFDELRERYALALCDV